MSLVVLRHTTGHLCFPTSSLCCGLRTSSKALPTDSHRHNSSVIVCSHGLLAQGNKLWRGDVVHSSRTSTPPTRLRLYAVVPQACSSLVRPAAEGTSGSKKRTKLRTEGPSRRSPTAPQADINHAHVGQRVQQESNRKVTSLSQITSINATVM